MNSARSRPISRIKIQLCSCQHANPEILCDRVPTTNLFFNSQLKFFMTKDHIFSHVCAWRYFHIGQYLQYFALRMSNFGIIPEVLIDLAGDQYWITARRLSRDYPEISAGKRAHILTETKWRQMDRMSLNSKTLRQMAFLPWNSARCRRIFF